MPSEQINLGDDDSTSSLHLLQPLQPFLDGDDVLEVCINRPGSVWVERHRGWQEHDAPQLTLERCLRLAKALGTLTRQVTDQQHPLLAASLPMGERVQIVQPPACARGSVSFTIRKPSTQLLTLDDLARSGLFSRTRPAIRGVAQHEHALHELLQAGRHEDFLRMAVQSRQVIVACGHTGCGKTTVLKALAELIPRDKRVITIESVPEVLLPNHRNKVHLYWSDGGQGSARVTPEDLLMASLRMRPDWILLAEARGREFGEFIEAAGSGHAAMTTAHASSVRLAEERMSIMLRKSPQGAGMSIPESRRLIALVVDVIVQFGNDGSGRYIEEIQYDPARKLRIAQGEAA